MHNRNNDDSHKLCLNELSPEDMVFPALSSISLRVNWSLSKTSLI
jgi:hypothetical protein